MSVSSGPSVLNSGLVFAYDMNNTNTSWKGAPTTNLNAGQSLNGMSGIALTLVGEENGWKKYSINGTWASGTYPFSMNISTTTLSGTVAYSAQAIIKTNVRSKFLTFGGLNYVNDVNMVNGGVSTVTSLGNDTDGLEMILSKREGFIYSAGYANPTTSQPGYISSRPTADGVSFSSTTDFVWVKNVQVEQGTFCTPWVSSARSDTQALFDLTNLNTITTSNVTYNSSNTFSFNGSTNYLMLNQNIFNNNLPNFTISAWVNKSVDGIILGNHLGGSTWESFWLATNSFIVNAANNNTTNRQELTFSTPNNTWANIVAVSNNTAQTMTVYHNGTQTATKSANVIPWNSTVVPAMGAYRLSAGGVSYALNGQIGYVTVYNKALTPSEVAQNFNALRGRYGI